MQPSLEETLAQTGIVIHEVRGISMLPMLDQNSDKVVIKPIVDPVKKYDLPLFKRPNGQYVLHRIIAVRKKYCLICGDNQFYAEKVPYEWLLGVAVGYYKGDAYHSCDDKEYKKYVRRRVRTRRFRYLRWILSRVKNKVRRVFYGKGN